MGDMSLRATTLSVILERTEVWEIGRKPANWERPLPSFGRGATEACLHSCGIIPVEIDLRTM